MYRKFSKENVYDLIKNAWSFFCRVNYSLIVAIIALYWSFHTYNQLMPLNRAKIIFSDSDIHIVQDNNCCKMQSKKCDVAVINLKNIGKASAKKIIFKSYVFQPGENSAQMFNDWSVNELSPETSMKIGQIYLDHTAIDNLNKKQVDIIGSRVILAFSLKYEDEITKEEIKNYYFFTYALGTPDVYSLIGADFEASKSSFINEFQQKDADFLSYIRSIDLQENKTFSGFGDRFLGKSKSKLGSLIIFLKNYIK